MLLSTEKILALKLSVMASALGEEESSPEFTAAVNKIAYQLLDIAEIIDELEDMSRLDGGTVQAHTLTKWWAKNQNRAKYALEQIERVKISDQLISPYSPPGGWDTL